MATNAFNLSTMVGENFEMSTSKMARNPFNLSTMIGENLEIYFSQLVKNIFNLSTMVRENFENLIKVKWSVFFKCKLVPVY